MRRWLRFDGHDVTSKVAVALIGALAVTAVVAGAGARALQPQLAGVGAWLASGAELAHVNGLSGRPDGRITVRGADGHTLTVVQNGAGAYVIDQTTGRVSRIDPAQIAIAQSRGFGASGLQVVAGGGLAYAIDPVAGVVQRIDPTTLATIGRPLALPAPLGAAAIDAGGTLWIPLLASGQVLPIRGGRAGTAVDVGRPGDPLSLTIAAGGPVVTDAGQPATVAIGGRRLTVNLPASLATSAAGALLTPASTGGPLLPVLAPAASTLLLVDVARGSLTTVQLPVAGHQLDAPQVLGTRVYVPDETAGTVIVYDAAAAAFAPALVVTGRAGPLVAFVQSGLLWVSDPDGPAAIVVGPDGTSRAFGKDDAPAPGPRPSGPAVLPTPGRRGAPNPSPGPNGGGSAGGPPGTPAPVPSVPVPSPGAPAPTPTSPALGPAPTAVSAASAPGSITVTFTPPASGSPSGYVLLGGGTGGAGMTVSPSRVPAAGPFTFLVTGAVCSRTIQYTFQVAAVYPGGQAASAATTPVQPCVAPGPPTGLASAIASHQISLSWAPPASDGGSPVTYKVWWNGAVTSAMDVTGPSATITGLTNFSTYAIRVDAINGAGSASATLSVVLAGPSRGYGTTTYSGTYPQHFVYGSPSDSPVVGAQPLGGGVTVTCQELGATVKAVGGPSSSMQDRITGFGGAYLPDVFVLTPDNGTDSYSAPLWPCI